MPQSKSIQEEILELLELKERELQYNQIKAYFPDTGPYRREFYPKHCAFMAAGKDFQERAFVAANRTGKTKTGGCEMAYHLTGDYPAWWQGKKFLNAVECWAVGVTNQGTKEIQQQELLGDVNDFGSGLIPKESILTKPDGTMRITKKPGVADAVETVYVKHSSGGVSKVTFKSYEQGRVSFQGTKKQVIWLDEEPQDPGIYSECLTRLMDKYNPGIIYCTFTPLFGLSDVVLSFLPDGSFPRGGTSPEAPYKFVINVEWDEVPHMDDDQKARILESYSAHEREARSKGIPSLGSGAIYPYLEDSVTVEPFEIPAWWPKAYGMDVGWKKTAVVWGAQDPESKRVYLYSEHYEGEGVPAIHASAIKARGDWIWGAIDPASNTPGQADGKALIDLYESEGLNLTAADHAVESGIYKTGQMFASGQLKIFRTLKNTISEFRTYRRDEKGKIVKKNDHAMDAMRYLIQTGLDNMTSLPDPDAKQEYYSNNDGRDKLTGY